MSSPEITDKVRKALWASSGGLCAICKERLIETVKLGAWSVVGMECHICSPKRSGPRYDPEFPKHLLNDVSNLLLLCSKHHKIVDDHASIYPASDLRALKHTHESWVISTLEEALRPRIQVIADRGVQPVRQRPRLGRVEHKLLSWFAEDPTMLVKADPKLLERLVAEKLESSGYHVELRGGPGDPGYDILAARGVDGFTITVLIEIKRTIKPVSEAMVRSLYAAVLVERANKGILITTSRFSAAARQFASLNKHILTILDGTDLAAWLGGRERVT